MRKPTFWSPTWSDTYQAVQRQKMARGLKFWIKKVEGLYYLCSENKGADQLRGDREADLRLCFRICKMLVFSRHGSFVSNLVKNPEVRFSYDVAQQNIYMYLCIYFVPYASYLHVGANQASVTSFNVWNIDNMKCHHTANEDNHITHSILLRLCVYQTGFQPVSCMINHSTNA